MNKDEHRIVQKKTAYPPEKQQYSMWYLKVIFHDIPKIHLTFSPLKKSPQISQVFRCFSMEHQATTVPTLHSAATLSTAKTKGPRGRAERLRVLCHSSVPQLGAHSDPCRPKFRPFRLDQEIWWMI